jgi:hypothetical protein
VIRALNIALRTVHIGAMGVLLGGHAFDVAPDRLMVSLWLTIGTGVALASVEARPPLLWIHQGRGLMTVAKLALVCCVPLAWDHRLYFLLAAVAVASVGSHMPGRMRYYSVLYREVIHDGAGPGRARARGTGAEECRGAR